MPRADKGSHRVPYAMVPCTGCGVLVQRRAADLSDRVFHSRLCFQSYMDTALSELDRYRQLYGLLPQVGGVQDHGPEWPVPASDHEWARAGTDPHHQCLYVIGVVRDPPEPYLVRVGLTVRIGWTLSEIQAQRAEPLRLLALEPSTQEQERLLHEVIRSWRTRGEWYEFPAEKLVELVATVSQSFDMSDS